jgi:uncharacterized coiled-coil protein SlyX
MQEIRMHSILDSLESRITNLENVIAGNSDSCHNAVTDDLKNANKIIAKQESKIYELQKEVAALVSNLNFLTPSLFPFLLILFFSDDLNSSSIAMNDGLC